MNERGESYPAIPPNGKPNEGPTFTPAKNDPVDTERQIDVALVPNGHEHAVGDSHSGRASALTGSLPLGPDESEREDRGTGRTVLAEWALWGKQPSDPEYSVLRCSTGPFRRGDFHDIITRYASGRQESLPQYTVCWIPGENGHEGYLAVAIHELADPDPRRSGGRVRAARGREIEYTRLFCVSYSEMAQNQVSCTELVESVREYQLPVGPASALPIELLDTEPPSFSNSVNSLAQNVATFLLTTRPVRVLGAVEVSAEDRLRFIEQVMSLLPYGLRASMSASTWASATAMNLKLRLFFTSAERDDGGITVTWGQPKRYNLSAPEHTTLRHYVNWLERGGAVAGPELASMTDPVRFDPDEIRQMVATLPRDQPVKDTFEQLSDGLRRGELPVVRAAVKRLRLRGNRPISLEEQNQYRREIKRLGLFNDYPWMAQRIAQDVYQALLRLAFGPTLSYADFREIVALVGGPPHRRLAAEMLRIKFKSYLPWLLTYKSVPDLTDQEVLESLHNQNVSADEPITEFCRLTRSVHLEDRPDGYDFAFLYLSTYSPDLGAELVARGYLTQTLEQVFPRDRKAQRERIKDMLMVVYGRQLTKEQSADLLNQPEIERTAAFEEAVRELAARRGHRKQLLAPGLRVREPFERAARKQVTLHAGTVVIGIAIIVGLTAFILLIQLIQNLHG